MYVHCAYTAKVYRITLYTLYCCILCTCTVFVEDGEALPLEGQDHVQEGLPLDRC